MLTMNYKYVLFLNIIAFCNGVGAYLLKGLRNRDFTGKSETSNHFVRYSE